MWAVGLGSAFVVCCLWLECVVRGATTIVCLVWWVCPQLVLVVNTTWFAVPYQDGTKSLPRLADLVPGWLAEPGRAAPVVPP